MAQIKRKREDRYLKPVRANAGIEADYRARLDKLVQEMHGSIQYWIEAAYKANEPLNVAQDALPSRVLQAAFQKLSSRWLARFDEAAPMLAKRFADGSLKHTDAALKSALRQSGVAIKWEMTPQIRDAVGAVLNENVGLIRSIAQSHLTQVEGLVMRSISEGRDLGTLSRALQDQFGVSRRRAALISRDQSAKAIAVIQKSRQQELGIKEAIWCHSSAGRHPRPEHVAANGKRYDVSKGMYLEGEWVWPGTAINCRCFSKAVLPWTV